MPQPTTSPSATPTPPSIKPTVLDYDDICRLAPVFNGHPHIVKALMHLLAIDKVNDTHSRYVSTPGVAFTQNMLRGMGATIAVRGEHVLDHLPQGSMITVSNHPLGAIDGIMLIKLIGERRPDFKVMVNMILNYIGAMRENFIAVDALASNDPEKRKVSIRGIAQALSHVKEGHALGFFPAGAVSKFTRRLTIEDRPWQPTVMRIIQKANAPVIPIYFHDRNSLWFNILGVIDWRLRTLRLPAEVFHRKQPRFRVSVGEPISPATIAQYPDPEQLGTFLKAETYKMRDYHFK